MGVSGAADCEDTDLAVGGATTLVLLVSADVFRALTSLDLDVDLTIYEDTPDTPFNVLRMLLPSPKAAPSLRARANPGVAVAEGEAEEDSKA